MTPATEHLPLITIGGVPFSAAGAPYVVGVINVSPESPNADSIVSGSAGALARAATLTAGGARLLDIGGQSSHFRSPLVSVEEEIARLLPPLRELVGAGYLVSVDTWRAEVVRVAAANGAAVINDSDGFQDPDVIAAIAESGLPVILPFLNGPNPRETEPFDEHAPMDVMLRWFDAALNRAAKAGVRQLILDPGTGYAQPHLSTEAKEAFQRRVYPELPRLRALGFPLFVALPRKTSRAVTIELATMIVRAGVEFLRAHDPSVAAEAIAAVRAGS